MENIRDLNSLTTAELLAYLAKQEKYNPKFGMCDQVENAVLKDQIIHSKMWAVKYEINHFIDYIVGNWKTSEECYLRDVILAASDGKASLLDIDQLCREIYLNWDNRFNLVNDFINNHRWGN